ncbi:nitroreductase [Synergistales bacterium]|nr:nitroreductase [Synergistales bacterium]
MNKLQFTVDNERCVRCDACIQDCPRKIIHQVNGFPDVSPEEDDCLGCQHCLAICPTGAVSIFGLNPADSIPLDSTAFPTAEKMRALVCGRRTVRKYSEQNVDRALIDTLLADTAHAPTGGNTCGLTFSVVDNRRELMALLVKIIEIIETAHADGREIPEFILESVRAYRRDGSDEVFRGAPHLLIVTADKKAYCGETDVIIALSYFELMAFTEGVGTTWCGFIKFIIDTVPEVRGLLGIAPEQPFYAMAFGIPTVHYSRTVQRSHAAQIKTLR